MKKLCPVCKQKLKRKGSGKNKYFKCPHCNLKFDQDLQIIPPKGDPDILRAQRSELAKRKFIRQLKRKKYLPFRFVEWKGEIIDLEAYDKDGNLIKKEEKKQREVTLEELADELQ